LEIVEIRKKFEKEFRSEKLMSEYFLTYFMDIKNVMPSRKIFAKTKFFKITKTVLENEDFPKHKTFAGQNFFWENKKMKNQIILSARCMLSQILYFCD
jgi:hypothetical protein